MNILKNLNKRLLLIDGNPCYGGEDLVKQVIETSPISLPQDYIEFLKEFSGDADSLGIELKVSIPGDETGTRSLSFYSAQFALEKHEEYKVFSAPLYDEIIDSIWLIGDDLGDLLYFYGEGNDGFGLYVSDAGALSFEDADKISSTLTELLVNGAGIDTAIWRS